MDLLLIAKILRMRARLRSHERWSETELRAHQQRSITDLREHAMTHSRFYQRFHRGLERAQLHELPVLTKRELMASFDELVTDRDVRLADVQRHLAELKGNEKYLDRYWVSRTAGSSGRVVVCTRTTKTLLAVGFVTCMIDVCANARSLGRACSQS